LSFTVRLALVLVLALGVGVGPDAGASPQAPPAPPRIVNFSAHAIEASNPAKPGPADPAVPLALVSELKSTFQFTQYKSLGTAQGSAPVGGTWKTALGTSGLSLEVMPKSADAATITVDVRLLRSGAPVVTSTLRLAPGGQVMVGGPTTQSGRLVVALSGR
jgi:hypothetical protein